MMKRYCAAFTVLAVILLFCSCKAGNPALPNTIKSQDGSVRIDTPETWSIYDAEPKDNLVLTVQDGAGALGQVFWFPEVEGKDFTGKDYADKALEYYGDDAQSVVKSVKINDTQGYCFSYIKQGLDKDGITYTYKGYEYFFTIQSGAVETDGTPKPLGVVEVDIFCRYTDTEPTNDQLEQLKSIAESIRVKA